MLLLSGAILGAHWIAFFKSIQVSTVAIGLLSYVSYPLFTSVIEPIFFVAIDSLAGADDVDLPELKSPAALHIAMMRAAKLFIPEDFIRNANAATLRAIISAPNNSKFLA